MPKRFGSFGLYASRLSSIIGDPGTSFSSRDLSNPVVGRPDNASGA